MASISDQMRDAWAAYACKREKMTRIGFGPDSILVAPETVDAWRALESVLSAFGYDIRIDDTDSYACREIKSGGAKSLHSYGIALDINWHTNPYLDHAGTRKPRFSEKPTQEGRAGDVKLGKADTDMTRAMVDAALAIRTNNGKQVFGWGGDWRSLKDAMHFQIEVTPGELASGIDWSTVEGGAKLAAAADLFGHVATLPAASPAAVPAANNGAAEMGLPAIFFDTVRGPLFGGGLSQTAVDNMTTIVRYWLNNFPGNPLNQLAYILATVRAEVGGNMHPVRETFATSDAQARQRLAHKPYAQSKPPFGHAYYGRGYVQLTHDFNYKTQSEKLGVDLLKDPDSALRPEIAIQVLVNGMMDGDFNGQGKGLAFYVNEAKQDFVNARRTVNVLDRAQEIAGFADTFLSALQKARNAQGPLLGLVPGQPEQPVTEHVVTTPPFGQPTPPSSPPLVPPGPQSPLVPGSALGTILAGLSPSDYAILMKALGVDEPTRVKLEEVLGAMEKAGILKPASGLTPVNGALGETLGKWLDGKKTVIGVIAMIASIFLPQFAPIINLITGAAGAVGDAAPQAPGAATTAQGILMPLAALFTGWGALGKIDKWLHKPAVTSVAGILAKMGK